MQKWPSPAKLNLFLYITGQRADGYHNLQTLFQFIDYCDYLTFTPRQDKQIQLLTSFADVKPEDNLIIKAANRLLSYAKEHEIKIPTSYGMDIEIDKILPMGGGLGGGSSNAATTLVALNHLWRLSLTCDQLMSIGATLGADIPIFIYGHSAFAQGIGDHLVSVNIPEKWYLIIKPNINISTVSIFTAPELKRDTVTRKIEALLDFPFHNDCEPTVRSRYPQIEYLITLLSAKAPTRLTGTGSCIFCECDNQQQAQDLQQYLNQSNIEADTISFIAKAINESPLYVNLIDKHTRSIS